MRDARYRLLGLVVVLAVMVSVAPVDAKRPTCKIVNQSTQLKHDTLQEAINAAIAGDTLQVMGTCIGTSTVDKTLTIKGKSNPAWGTATLDGNQAGSVLRVTGGVTLDLTDIVITNGSATRGGGINLAGTVNLNGTTTITGNTAHCSGTFCTAAGGGIYKSVSGANPTATVTLNGGTITGNTASCGGGLCLAAGGGIYNKTGGGSGKLTSTVALNGTTVTGNRVSCDNDPCLAWGGGIYNEAGPAAGDPTATVTLDGGTTVTGNTATCSGGSCENDGGGIYNVANAGGGTPTAAVTIIDGSVTSNSPNNIVNIQQ